MLSDWWFTFTDYQWSKEFYSITYLRNQCIQMKVAWWPKYMSTLGMDDDLMVNECQKILFGI